MNKGALVPLLHLTAAPATNVSIRVGADVDTATPLTAAGNYTVVAGGIQVDAGAPDVVNGAVFWVSYTYATVGDLIAAAGNYEVRASGVYVLPDAADLADEDDVKLSYLVRAHTAIGQSTAAQRIGAHHNGSTADVYAGTPGYSIGAYPNGPNNGLMTGALELHALGIRGTLPGLLHPVQDCGNAFATGAIVDGTDDLAGRRLMAIRTAPPAGAVVAGTVFIDVTGPWGR